MCGIVAVLATDSSRPAPSAESIIGELDLAVGHIGPHTPGALAEASAHLDRVNQLLYGRPGVRTMIANAGLAAGVAGRIDQLDAWVAAVEAALETTTPADELEAINAALVQIKDLLWAIRADRLRTVRCVVELAGRAPSEAAVDALTLTQVALSSIDRLEVRGRDSAGIHLLVTGHGLDQGDPAVHSLMSSRSDNPLFTNGAVRFEHEAMSFVYKAAAEIGELGDNTRALRSAIAADELLHLALTPATARVSVVAHTRWASVGIISEPNCHPVNSEEVERPLGVQAGPYMVGAAQWRRRQPCRSEVGERSTDCVTDHDRCEGHSDARISAGRCDRRSR